MPNSFTWGRCDQYSAQGWAHQLTHYGRHFWSASWSGTHDTLMRDGSMTYRDHVWRSENNIDVIYPYAVTDDFGVLVPVPGP